MKSTKKRHRTGRHGHVSALAVAVLIMIAGLVAGSFAFAVLGMVWPGTVLRPGFAAVGVLVYEAILLLVAAPSARSAARRLPPIADPLRRCLWAAAGPVLPVVVIGAVATGAGTSWWRLPLDTAVVALGAALGTTIRPPVRRRAG
ncbi:hypothetical protein [Actinoallomurus iriomotensis]|uniref:Uncharacterized protein n=1 Tax=Actinoallomurus iriomotensis TaxID=478107 RepID=A0A9W6W0V7_9ACTN|nr:hypothetical protein [Actinoallomurus iriomotensis]GLY85326.1 hypothetical protein Airi02_032550 [Actinoallomurus iriomotensis]